MTDHQARSYLGALLERAQREAVTQFGYESPEWAYARDAKFHILGMNGVPLVSDTKFPIACLCKLVEYGDDGIAACEVRTGEMHLPRVAFGSEFLRALYLEPGMEFVWFMEAPRPELPPKLSTDLEIIKLTKAKLELVEMTPEEEPVAAKPLTSDEIRTRNEKFFEILKDAKPVSEAAVDAVCQFTRNRMWRLDYVPAKYFLPGHPQEELLKLYRELALFGYIALDGDGNPCCLTGRDPKIPREPMDELQTDVAHLLKTLDSDGYVMAEQVNKVIAHLVRLVPLERRVNWMLDQKFDDLCWLDAYRELGKILGREFKPEQMPREQFLANCAAYHDSLARNCPYQPPHRRDNSERDE